MSSGCPRRRAAAAGAPLLGKLPGKVRLCGPQPVNLTSGEGKKSEQLRAEIQSEATATERGSERLIAPPAGGGRRSWKVEERRERKGAFMQPPPRCTGGHLSSHSCLPESGAEIQLEADQKNIYRFHIYVRRDQKISASLTSDSNT